jgi:hypothetical protein
VIVPYQGPAVDSWFIDLRPGLRSETAMSIPQEPTQRSGWSKRRKKAVQVVVIVALIVACGAGGAAYHFRYGDRTNSNYTAIQEATKELLKIEVPDRLWPRIMVTRPDVMTMVVYASKSDDSCLAIISCLPEWTREHGNRPDRLLQSALEQYCPQFDSERWTGTEERDITVRGVPQRVKIASSFRSDDHKEVRIVSLDGLQSEKGSIVLYYQSSLHSSTDDEIDRLLKSLQ